jgi:UDP-N-acetyl-alpha-D-muramoyl-L-alanyl-L-glutamate epimerase
MGSDAQGPHHQARLLAPRADSVRVASVVTVAEDDERAERFTVDRFTTGRLEVSSPTVSGRDVLFGSRLWTADRADVIEFCERLALPVALPEVLTSQLMRTLDLLAIAIATSYAKVAAVRTLGTHVVLDQAAHAFVHALYDDGLREFTARNGLTVPRPIVLDTAEGAPHLAPAAASTSAAPASRPVVPFGAGRDSTLLLSTLRDLNPIGFTVKDNIYARRVCEWLDVELLTAERHLDPLLFTLNSAAEPHRALNGHVPVTAVNSLISILVAQALGSSAVLMANERSASESTRIVDGVEVNHQWSKSLACEQLLRAALAGVDYVSLLRPWGELPIARAFARLDSQLHRRFMSCNQAFLINDERRSDGWCCACPKCHSVFLSLAPFLGPDDLTGIFGTNLLADESQIAGFADLVDPTSKPYECVGEVAESAAALVMVLDDVRWSGAPVVEALRPRRDQLMGLSATSDVWSRSADHCVSDAWMARLTSVLDG